MIIISTKIWTAYQKLEKLFYDNAGWSYQPGSETSEEGHIRCARELANAYLELQVENAFVGWEIDPDITSADWSDDEPERSTWMATLYYKNKVVGSLGGIDIEFPTNDPYANVVEAELWQEFAANRESMIERGEN